MAVKRVDPNLSARKTSKQFHQFKTDQYVYPNQVLLSFRAEKLPLKFSPPLPDNKEVSNFYSNNENPVLPLSEL
jgi:hypothetical protein